MTILAFETGLAPSWMTASAAGVLALLTSLCLVRKIGAIAGTTLVAPWVWSMISLWSVAGVEIGIGWTAADAFPPWGVAFRFAAAVSVFCPAMAILGAKRPQNRPWQFLVASLWVVLSLPAWESLLLRPGQPFELQDSRWWCFPALLLIGTINYLPTRFWASALAFAGAQAFLVAGFLPLLPASAEDSRLVQASLALMALSALLATLVITRRRRSEGFPLDRLWFDFRDSYGVLWGLRMAQRVNATANASGWDITLRWQGFSPGQRSAGEDRAAKANQAVERNFESLLRRFVSRRWIARRRAP